MSDYKERMKTEYADLKERCDTLHRMLVKYDAGKLSALSTRQVNLMKDQEIIMKRYLNILEIRAEIEGIEL